MSDDYLNNVLSLEPNIALVWGQNDCAQSSQATAQISIAISLKRIADILSSSAATGVTIDGLCEAMGIKFGGDNYGLIQAVMLRIDEAGFKVVHK